MFEQRQGRQWATAALLLAAVCAGAVYLAQGPGSGGRASHFGLGLPAAATADSGLASPPQQQAQTDAAAAAAAAGQQFEDHLVDAYPPPGDWRFPFAANETATAAATTACGTTFWRRLVLHPPFEQCDAAALTAAVSAGWREVRDGPFHMTGCAVRWFSADEACDLLQSAGALVLVGDSLTRHLAQAVVTVLLGDYANGTAAVSGDPARKGHDPHHPPCTCRAAYDDGHRADSRRAYLRADSRYCRDHSAAYLPYARVSGGGGGRGGKKKGRGKRGKRGGKGGGGDAPSPPPPPPPSHYYCPRWTAPHLLVATRGSSKQPLPPGSIVYIAGGLHHPALDNTTVRAVFGPGALHGVLAPGAAGNHTRVCGLMHAPGVNKPVQYLRGFGLPATTAFNAAVRAWGCAWRPGDSVFDPFAVTRNATSIDGQHYSVEPNALLAQLLLNHVDALVRERAATSVGDASAAAPGGAAAAAAEDDADDSGDDSHDDPG